jgi:hypothetical protein
MMLTGIIDVTVVRKMLDAWSKVLLAQRIFKLALDAFVPMFAVEILRADFAGARRTMLYDDAKVIELRIEATAELYRTCFGLELLFAACVLVLTLGVALMGWVRRRVAVVSAVSAWLCALCVASACARYTLIVGRRPDHYQVVATMLLVPLQVALSSKVVMSNLAQGALPEMQAFVENAVVDLRDATDRKHAENDLRFEALHDQLQQMQQQMRQMQQQLAVPANARPHTDMNLN